MNVLDRIETAAPPPMEPAVSVPCVVCGGAVFVTICSADEIAAQQRYLCRFHRRRLKPGTPPEALEERADFTQDYATDIVTCTNCGLLLRNPRPSRAAIARAYQQDRYGEERLETLFVSQRDQFRPKAQALAAYLRGGARIVAVGSFVGGFLAAGREQGWDILGVDPGKEAADFCRKRGLPVLQGTLQEAPLAPGSVDCVVVWNTFDQMPDPGALLARAQTLLRPDGRLLMRVPNGACFRLGVAGYRKCRHTFLRPSADLLLCAMAWNNLLAFPYLFGYSVPTLDRLMSACGLTRSAVHADTLVRLADEATLSWAAWEERSIKFACRLLARLEGLRASASSSFAPWIDVTYRVGSGHACLPHGGATV